MAENGGDNAMGETYDPFAQPYVPPSDSDPAAAATDHDDDDDEQRSATHPWGPMNDDEPSNAAAAAPPLSSPTSQQAHRERSKSPPRPSGVSGAMIDHKGKRLYVGQLSFDTTDEELRTIFTKIG